jgi:hypothetical protein
MLMYHRIDDDFRAPECSTRREIAASLRRNSSSRGVIDLSTLPSLSSCSSLHSSDTTTREKKKHDNYGTSVDIYSFGRIIARYFSHANKSEHQSDGTTPPFLQAIMKHMISISIIQIDPLEGAKGIHMHDHVTDAYEWNQMITECSNTDPERRPRAAQLLKRLLRMNPTQHDTPIDPEVSL